MVFMEILSHIFFFKYAISSNNICQMIFWVNLVTIALTFVVTSQWILCGKLLRYLLLCSNSGGSSVQWPPDGQLSLFIGIWDRASVKTASVELQSTPVDTFWPQNAFSHNLYANYFGIIFSHQRRLTFNSFGDALLSSMWLLLLPEANRHFINISQK